MIYEFGSLISKNPKSYRTIKHAYFIKKKKKLNQNNINKITLFKKKKS